MNHKVLNIIVLFLKGILKNHFDDQTRGFGYSTMEALCYILAL